MSILDIGERICTKNKVRDKLKAYDHRILDQAAAKIIETVKDAGNS